MSGGNKRAFTILELVVVMGMITVSVPMMWPLFRARELAKRASCATNLSMIGRGFAMYCSASADQWPWLVSSNKWSAATGQSQTVAPSEKADYNVSALLFMLVRDGQAPGIFICPSTSDTPDESIKTQGDYHWDFSPYYDGNAEHLSYSYQAPLTDGKEWSSGVTSSSDSAVLIAADRTAAYEGLKADFNWADPEKADPNTGMSQNHTRGQFVNLLFVDTHVGYTERADVGFKSDNIYSCAGLKDGQPLETNPGAGTLKLDEHRSLKDSFLMGPAKLDKKPK